MWFSTCHVCRFPCNHWHMCKRSISISVHFCDVMDKGLFNSSWKNLYLNTSMLLLYHCCACVFMSGLSAKRASAYCTTQYPIAAAHCRLGVGPVLCMLIYALYMCTYRDMAVQRKNGLIFFYFREPNWSSRARNKPTERWGAWLWHWGYSSENEGNYIDEP